MEKTISPKRVKMAVYNRIDFELSEEFWEEIDTAFAECWNEVIGYGNDMYKETIVGYIVGHLKRKRIMLSVDKVDRIVGIILDYIKMVGGFLDEDAVVIPVKPKRDKKGRFLKKEEEQDRTREKILQFLGEHNQGRKELLQRFLSREEFEKQMKSNNPAGYGGKLGEGDDWIREAKRRKKELLQEAKEMLKRHASNEEMCKMRERFADEGIGEAYLVQLGWKSQHGKLEKEENEGGEENVAHHSTEEELQEFVRMTNESQENLQRLIALGLELPEGEGKRQRRKRRLEELGKSHLRQDK